MAESRPRQLRRLLSEPGILVLPGVYDCLSARLAEQAGFPALFTSGFGFSASILGQPDLGVLTAFEVLTAAENLARSVRVPVVADLDTGYGGVLNVRRSISKAVSAGVAGVILEDQVWPKKCGHFEGKQVVSSAEHVKKIRAACSAREDSGLVIIARTDSRAVEGFDAAVERGRAYFEAGADIIFIEAPQSLDELGQIPQALVGIPVIANMIEGGKTPLLSAQELASMGYKIVVYPLSGLFAATGAMREVFAYLRSRGTTQGFSSAVDFAEFKKVVDVAGWQSLEQLGEHD